MTTSSTLERFHSRAQSSYANLSGENNIFFKPTGSVWVTNMADMTSSKNVFQNGFVFSKRATLSVTFAPLDFSSVAHKLMKNSSGQVNIWVDLLVGLLLNIKRECFINGIGGFHVTSSPPCWWTVNKRSLISSLCLSTSICSFHHCYLCLPGLHENHLLVFLLALVYL